MSKECGLGFESLSQKILLSANPWYIDATKAAALWTLPKTDKPVVAIIDSGLDLNNASLASNLWINSGDLMDGIDNDNNGYVDDTNGWNFYNNSNVVQDRFYHGTSVAGVINIVSNGAVTLMPLKFMDDSGVGYGGDAIRAIHYAVDMKLRGVNLIAINCSFGGTTGESSLLDAAIRRASDNGILVVISAGNSGGDNDVVPRYPGSYRYANTISVAATNSDLTLAGYSNYGKNSVDLAAPGSYMYTSVPGGSYSYLSGTSFSAPVVAGAAALLKSVGDYAASAIKNAILEGSDLLSGLVDRVRNGFLNISKAYTKLSGQTLEYSSPSSPVVESVSPVVQNKEVVYGLVAVNKREVRGWASVTNSSSKVVVEVYINGRLRYSVGTNSNDAFRVKLHRKFFNHRWNRVDIRLKEPSSNIDTLAWSGKIRR